MTFEISDAAEVPSTTVKVVEKKNATIVVEEECRVAKECGKLCPIVNMRDVFITCKRRTTLLNHIIWAERERRAQESPPIMEVSLAQA